MQEWLAASKILPDSYSGPEHSRDEDADGLTLSPREQQQAHASCGSKKPPKKLKNYSNKETRWLATTAA